MYTMPLKQSKAHEFQRMIISRGDKDENKPLGFMRRSHCALPTNL